MKRFPMPSMTAQSITRMLGATLPGLLLFVAASQAFGLPQDQMVSQEELRTFGQYFQIPTFIRGGKVTPNWFKDGTTFWFLDPPGSKFVDPMKKEMRRLTSEEKDSWEPEKPNVQGARIYSPDFERFVMIKDGNIWVHGKDGSDKRCLNEATVKDVFWAVPAMGWSPDGTRLAALCTDARQVHHLPVIDYTEAEEKFREVPYTKSGGGFMRLELAVFRATHGGESGDASAEAEKTDGYITILDAGTDEDVYLFPVGWREDGTEFIFMRMTRDAKRLDLMAGDPGTGACRVILTEQQDTFIGGLDFITSGGRNSFTPLEGTTEFLWLSERDGWRHIYHYDLDGRLIRRLTEGAFPVERVTAVDSAKGHVFFMANGEKRLYDTHLYRVDFKGEGFKRLTAGDGDHAVQISPSRACFIDTWSSPTRPPVTELRSADGELLLTLSEADTSQLDAMGWKPPETFVVKAHNGETDLYGVLYKPADFDPEKRFPVIDFIYAGPFTTVVPNTFVGRSAMSSYAQAMAQMGFITFVVDCRGTTERGKAFQDASYGRIGQIEIPDHVATLRQLAAERPYMDLDRVGIFGSSWGGYFVLRAMLTAPDVFHVGVSAAPGDLTEAQPINEPYMGLPQDNPEGYAAGSNPAAAHQLKGKLLLIHGTADINAPFSTTMRMVDALVKAGKQHDLCVLPQADHYFRGQSGQFAMMRTISYFREHLGEK